MYSIDFYCFFVNIQYMSESGDKKDYIKKVINVFLVLFFIFLAYIIISNNKIEEKKPFEEIIVDNYLSDKKEDKRKVVSLSADKINEMLKNDEYILIDIRTFDEFESGKIEGALNIDFYDPGFENKIASLDKNKKYIYYCRSGNRSTAAKKIFEKYNLEAYELEGGVIEWAKSGFNLVK